MRDRGSPEREIDGRDRWSHTPELHRYIFRGQYRMVHVSVGVSSYPAVDAAGGSVGPAWGPLSRLSLCVAIGLRMVRERGTAKG